ncbi:MAG: glycosyl transferase family 1 [Chloroflexota bacterium]|nr:glycosyltransferase family 1 protein [Chloroflexota bacterium]NOG64257.1 glycosyltransferase [Chloroflexota bacterium]GIK65902.1 MAG: glycosyl transferase family 1 [Chloroflexota bacterium]
MNDLLIPLTTCSYLPRRVAMLSIHTSPMASLGGKKTGGMNVYVREIACAMGRRGIKVDVFTRENAPETVGAIVPMGENARLIYLPAGPTEVLDPDVVYPYLADFRDALLDFTRTNGLHYDLIYSHYWLSGVVAYELKQIWKVPFIQMFHTLGHMKTRIDSPRQPSARTTQVSLQVNRRVMMETEIINQADRLIAATPAERMQMLWLYRANRRRIETVSPGVDLMRFHPFDKELARQKIGLQPNEKMLLFVGRIEPLKGVDTICEALARLKLNAPDTLREVKMVIIGGDPTDMNHQEMQRIRTKCCDLGLEETMIFIGAKDQDALPYYYNAAEVLIMPSDYESFGMVALEAMACGTPVIASQVGGLAFLVRDGETGYLVPVREPAVLAEAIRKIVTHPERRAKMSEAATEVAEQYSWGRIVDQLLVVFSELLEQMRPIPCTTCVCGQ